MMVGSGLAGGGGSSGRNPGGNGAGPSLLDSTGGDGGANTGGGGGGVGQSQYQSYTGIGGAGGSGIVVIRYAGAQRTTGGTVTMDKGYTYHAFTTSGIFTY
jgi:hypothetical protein